MAYFFAERMKHLLSENSDDTVYPSSAALKAEKAVDEFQLTLADHLHGDKISWERDESVRSWLSQLEAVTYKYEGAVFSWKIVCYSKLYAEVIKSKRWALIRLMRCFGDPDAAPPSTVKEVQDIGRIRLAVQLAVEMDKLKAKAMCPIKLAVAMKPEVESLCSKGKRLVDPDKFKRLESFPDQVDQEMVPFVREGDKSYVLKHLLSTENGAVVKVISIAGFGGSGKTTLARSLYNHPRVEQHFTVRVWVHVSNVFDGRKIATKFLDSLKIDYPKESVLESLLQLLQEFFSGKTVLAVFDDVWTEEDSKWEPFMGLFGSSEVGSRVLVTTRSEGAFASAIVHTLAPLKTEDCSTILNSVANVQSLHRTAKSCEGSPLVAKNLGMKLQLQSKDTTAEEVYMEDVCMVRFRQFYHSFDILPYYMKSCLLYTVTFFPKKTEIDSEKLIGLWMSQGYLGYPAGNSHDRRFIAYHDVENKGYTCLSKLIGLCFFEKIASRSIHKPYPLSCKMPDAAHDFVTYMTRRYDLRDIKERSRFFSPEIQVNPGLFVKMKHITALVLSSCRLDELPYEVGVLFLLRYLDLSDNPLKQLPGAICRLLYLEFLDVHFCYLLSRLPGLIRDLRHLRINHTTEELHDLPRGFEKLTLLQTLDVFRVGGPMYKEALTKLSNLNHLVDICISVHGEVHFPDAILQDKIYMENLELCFVGEGRNQDMSSTIEELKPPPNLKLLKFEHYPRLALPKWILDESLIKGLKRLSLRSAANISSLPALWKLSTLEFLWLYDMPDIKHLGCEFFGLPSTSPQQHHSPGHQQARSPLMSKDEEDDDEEEEQKINEHSKADGEIIEEETGDAEREEAVAFSSLKTLRIEYLVNWETWEDAKEVNMKVMPCLEELIIADCIKFKGNVALGILRDTPWYKSSYQREEAKSMGGAHEKNMKQPSQECSSSSADNKNKGANVALKASYKKLKKFVRDAYITKGPAQYLKISIQEGVLGKTEVTSYLSLDYLHDWFEKDCSIFAEQLCVWSRLIYELMTPSDKERVQMASSSLITTVGRQRHSYMRAEDLVDFMIENKAKLYLVPYLRPEHWELLAIVPETEAIYWFDSLQSNISPELTEFLKMFEREYVTRNLNSSVSHDSWKVVDIKHKRQVDDWESGYYVMIWMQKIALEIQGLNLESHFPIDKSSYEPNKLREVDLKWCAHVLPEFLA